MFSSAFGQLQQLHEWTVSPPSMRFSGVTATLPVCVSPQNFVAFNEFCIRACRDSPQAPALCNHIYDVMGCAWNMPGDYNTGFDQCQGDSGEVRPVPSCTPQRFPSAPPRRRIADAETVQ